MNWPIQNPLAGIGIQLAAILAGQSFLQRQMSAIATQLTAIQGSITALQGDVATLATGITGLEATITQLQQSIANQGDVLSPATQTILTNLVTQAATAKTAADAAVAELPTSAT